MHTSPSLIFPPELRTAFFVPRWAIVHTMNKDTVANHSYFVIVYSRIIAHVIGWTGPMDVLMWQAAAHDLDETITGDIVSPVKKEIIDKNRMTAYVERKMMSRLGFIMDLSNQMEQYVSANQQDEIDRIIGVADRLDAVLYLILEERIGNRVVDVLIKETISRLEEAWHLLPAPRVDLRGAWQQQVVPAIEAHRTQGGRGL